MQDGLNSYPFHRPQPCLSKTAPPLRTVHAPPPLADCSNTSRPALAPYAQHPHQHQQRPIPSALGQAPSPAQAPSLAVPSSSPARQRPSATGGMSSTQPAYMQPAVRTSISVPSPPLAPPATLPLSPHSPHAPHQGVAASSRAGSSVSPSAQPSQPPPWAAAPVLPAGRGDSLDEFRRASTAGSGGGVGRAHGGPVPQLPWQGAQAQVGSGAALAPYLSQQAGPHSPSVPPFTARQTMGADGHGHPSPMLQGGSTMGVAGHGPDVLHRPTLPTQAHHHHHQQQQQQQQQQLMTPQPRFAARPPWGEYDQTPAGPAVGGSGRLRGMGPQAATAPLQHAQLGHAPQPGATVPGLGSPGGVAAGSVSKAAARAQQSGSGAASCLVW